MTADDYLAEMGLSVEGWDRAVAQRDGVDVAVVVTKGTEIHFISLDEKRAMTRKNTLAFLKPIFDKFGFVTTRVPIDVADHRLRHILGFTQTWQDDRFTYWSMTELPFQKERHNGR